MEAIIIYKSKTGFTERYAKWIAEELNCECIKYEKLGKADLSTYDIIIYGGGIYAGRIAGLNWFKGKISELKEKICIVYATGATPAEVPEAQNVIKQNFTEEELATIKFFYLHSGLDFEKMGFVDKMVMKAFAKVVKNKKDKTSQDEAMADAINKSYDCTNKAFIEPIIRFVMEESKN